MIAFQSKVKTFDNLACFLYDLINFLDDLVSSCPKARKQFIENLKNERERAIYEQRFSKILEIQKNKINSYQR